MLTKEQWKQAPIDAMWYVNKRGVNVFTKERPLNYEDIIEPRPFDTYPCPFCGGTDLETQKLDWYGDLFYIACVTHSEETATTCATGPQRRTEEEAWQAWAKRV